MRCPICRIDSMRTVVSGGKEIDRCLTCGATWFDEGEIRELLEGRLDPAGDGPGEGAKAAEPEEPPALPAMHREASRLACPRCGGGLSALSYQATGVPVIHCRGCRGYLTNRASARALAARMRRAREMWKAHGALGASMAEETRRRMSIVHGGQVGYEEGDRIPLPVIVPLSASGPAEGGIPFVTWTLIGLMTVVQVLAGAGALPAAFSGRTALPSGAGFLDVPRSALILSLFLHGGVVPFVVNGFFLFALGDNLENRLGRVPFAFFLLLCGATANAAHVLWGPAAAPAALGASGAVAGLVGAYLVLFPNVTIRMYQMGRVVSVPAYLFACAWIAMVFLSGRGPVEDLFFSAPLSLHGSVAGLGAGVLGAIAWRSLE